MNKFLGVLQQYFGKSTFWVGIAIKIRNQVNAVIAAYLNDGIQMSNNGELWLIKQIAPKAKLFIDVGANAGEWSIAFLKYNLEAKGILFEPSPLALKQLKRNMDRFKFDNNAEVIPCAASDKQGFFDFYMEKEAGETSSLLKKHSDKDSKKIEIKVTTIDEECSSRCIEFIDFLKIDAEGFDYHVLKGAKNYIKNNNIGIIQFEYNDPWAMSCSTLFSAIDFLESNNYKVYLLKNKGLYHFDYNRYGEYYRYSNFVAVSDGFFSFRINNL